MSFPQATTDMHQFKKPIIALVATAVAVVIAAAALRPYIRSHSMRSEHVCVGNLFAMDAAKEQWALDHKEKATTNDTPTWEDLSPLIGRGTTFQIPVCPQGGIYILGRFGEPPRCSLERSDPSHHALPP